MTVYFFPVHSCVSYICREYFDCFVSVQNRIWITFIIDALVWYMCKKKYCHEMNM